MGGGALRDVLAGNTPYIFVKHFYATASLIGAVLCALLYNVFGRAAAIFSGAAAIVTLRLMAGRGILLEPAENQELIPAMLKTKTGNIKKHWREGYWQNPSSICGLHRKPQEQGAVNQTQHKSIPERLWAGDEEPACNGGNHAIRRCADVPLVKGGKRGGAAVSCLFNPFFHSFKQGRRSAVVCIIGKSADLKEWRMCGSGGVPGRGALAKIDKTV